MHFWVLLFLFIFWEQQCYRKRKFRLLTLTMILRVSSLGRKTQTERRSCMVLLLWKFSLFIFVWMGQDRPLLPGLWAFWRPASTTAGTDTNTRSLYPCFSWSPVQTQQHLWAQWAEQCSKGRAWGPGLQSATVETQQKEKMTWCLCTVLDEKVWIMKHCSTVKRWRQCLRGWH